MKTRILFGLTALVFWFAVSPVSIHAQENTLKVTIARPGEGEILYNGRDAPYVTVPIMGWVTTDRVDLKLVQVKLEVLQGARTVGSLTTTPAADGKYSFDVAVDEHNPEDHVVSECAAGACHFYAPFGFPAGAVQLRVTATDPAGHQAVADRSIVVEHPGSANVPVQVIIAEESNPAPKGLTITALTRLYEWRERKYIASTDADGRTLFNVEALGQASTRYVFRLDPIVIDGVQYASREPAQLTLPPGASTAEPVKLIVQSLRGQINATVTAQNHTLQNSLTVRAIELPSGMAYTSRTVDGKVALSNLPIAKYLLDVDGAEAASQGLQSQARTIDLTTSPITFTALQLVTASPRLRRGIVRDSEGNPLPLVWLAADEQGKSIRTAPTNGEFVSSGFLASVNSLWVIAPGYFRRSVALDSNRLDIELTREPETRDVSWGTGAITLPPETLATVTGNRLTLRRGWLWGKGTGAFTIATPDAEIELASGKFALESLLDMTSWLYLIDGQAKVTILDDKTETTMTSGQMMAFGFGVTHPIPVALDGNVVRILHAGESSPVRIATDTSPLARAQDELARRGISLKYLSIATVVLIVLIVGGLVVRRRRFWSA